jgi:hypothetical protein
MKDHYCLLPLHPLFLVSQVDRGQVSKQEGKKNILLSPQIKQKKENKNRKEKEKKIAKK